MSVGEFDLIARWFTRPPRRADRVPLGVGDDCALIAPTPGLHLVVSTDAMVEGRHFLSTVAPDRLGHKALAVNLSDLAACGAAPLGFTLALTLPRVDDRWLDGFSRGLFALADAQGIELVGGNTTAGPLNICITVFGEVPPGQALLRSGARAGDQLWVSHPRGGGLGDARLALEAFRGTVRLDADAFAAACARMEQPTPRLALGMALRGLATSAIDLSDGLLGDLAHVLARSAVGATIDADALPMSAMLAAQSTETQRECTLAGGDDYELLFTAPAAQAERVHAAAATSGAAVTCIGRIDAAPGSRVVDRHRRPVAATFSSLRPLQGLTPMAADDVTDARLIDGSAAQGGNSPPLGASAAFMRRHPSRWIALGFGSGLSPWAPGTVGTLWAWVSFLVFDRWLAATVRWAGGCSSARRWSSASGPARAPRKTWRMADPGAIVWDEVVAFWIVLWLVMPAGFAMQLIAFALFRFFDAVKPGPIGWIDQRFKRARGWMQGAGIIADDLAAALCTLLVIALWRFLFP